MTLELTTEDMQLIQMGLAVVIENIEDCEKLPWTPEARVYMAQMLNGSRNLVEKIEKTTGVKAALIEFEPGDEEAFLTKRP